MCVKLTLKDLNPDPCPPHPTIKTTKIIKLYICKNREIDITFENCLILRENTLSTIKFR